LSSARDRIFASWPDANHQPNEVTTSAHITHSRSPDHLSLSPINYSVIGIISIPGIMTGAILGGADVYQAARLQMIISFMISAATVLSCIMVTFFTLYVCVDSEHRIRGDRIHMHPHAFRGASSYAIRTVAGSTRRVWMLFMGSMKQLLLCLTPRRRPRRFSHALSAGDLELG
jgi:Uncharacterised protein family (UPF0014)